VILPVRREALKERSELDELDELRAARAESPAQRLQLALELSELTRELAEAAAAPWTRASADDLDEKAHCYLAPLRAAMRNR
jgi:hypothetical protein